MSTVFDKAVTVLQSMDRRSGPSRVNFQKLHSILRKVDEIPYVNRGGCGLVAYAMVEYIKKAHPLVETEIVYVVGEGDRSALEAGCYRSCHHAVVRIGKNYYDSEGRHSKKTVSNLWNYTSLLVIDKELAMSNINHGNWNKDFDRYEGVPVINELFGVHYEYA